jgi:DNA-binding NtrC family response regulator
MIFSAPPPAIHRLIGQSSAMAELRERVLTLARSSVPLLILGETGTGKEVFADAVVEAGGWTPFVRVNCAALPETIVDGELFGYERGAFTGAVRSHAGLVAQAHGGVLFLDELAELPLAVQAKLLRTFDSGEYRALGSSRTQYSSFRLMLATNGDLEQMVAGHRMRTDFVHRLGGLRITLPPLRARMEDIPLLTRYFLGHGGRRDAESPVRIADRAMPLLFAHSWPGNIRELRNVVTAAAALAVGRPQIEASHIAQVLLPDPAGAPPAADPRHPAEPLTLAEATRQAEEQVIRQTLLACGGVREAAAQRLGISPATLYRKLARLSDLPGEPRADESPRKVRLSGMRISDPRLIAPPAPGAP